MRDRLNREKQLGVDDTLAITRQIAGALDYAHAQGVIHRDIKPENILIHEGEAMLADFGIALAVREAGGNRLTETGLSLGTPQYMSPEQATAERIVDGRSDVYSLGAVVYEMLAGEPPHTGATAHAVIAKLLTERPVSLRNVRSSLSPALDGAVARALEKVPADRFSTAGKFVHALDAARVTGSASRSSGAGMSSRRLALVVGLPVGVLAIAVAAWPIVRNRAHASTAPEAFHSRTQITFTGNAIAPALSPDATQIAYVVQDCATSGCTKAGEGIEVQDVDGSAKRRIVDGAATIGYMMWSPDRRFLLFYGTFGSATGQFIVSTLGGEPRYLGGIPGTFLWSGDSLLMSELNDPKSRGWFKTETVNGDVRDSMRVNGLKYGGWFAMAFPEDRWVLIGGLIPHGMGGWIVDRRGKQSDTAEFTGAVYSPQVGGHDAWFPVRLGGSRYGVVRVSVDLRTGKFRPPFDTVLDAASPNFDVSADGRTVAYAEGGDHYDMWVLPLADALQGRLTEEHRVFASTSLLSGNLSPDGSHYVVEHTEAGPDTSRVVASILPVTGGGSGVNYTPPTDRRGSRWTEDGAAMQAAVTSPPGTRLFKTDPRTGTQESVFAIHDTAVQTFDALPGSGWAWVPSSRDRVRMQRNERDKPQDLLLPAGERTYDVSVSLDGKRLATWGVIKSAGGVATDTFVVNVVSLPDGRVTRWMTTPGDYMQANWLADGSLMVSMRINDPESAVTLYRVRAPAHVERLGTIQHAREVTWSRDGTRVAVITTELHGDVWLARSSATRR